MSRVKFEYSMVFAIGMVFGLLCFSVGQFLNSVGENACAQFCPGE